MSKTASNIVILTFNKPAFVLKWKLGLVENLVKANYSIKPRFSTKLNSMVRNGMFLQRLGGNLKLVEWKSAKSSYLLSK